MSHGCSLLILISKGQRARSLAWFILKGYWTITDSVINLRSWNCIHLLAMSQVWGQRSWLWGNDDWKSFPDHNWYCYPPIIMQFHTLTPMSQGCALLILGSKVKFMGIKDWKRFLDHNWLCNPPMIMKRHTLVLYESRMCLIDFWVKGLGLLHTCIFEYGPGNDFISLKSFKSPLSNCI